MSTFSGLLSEFPHIRIDNFQFQPTAPPALACFLSHVHSDHLKGLESLKSPFVYCSAATREILLRLEKYPHRMNFAKGILETRKQTYRHLKNLLKPIPLETPTTIELCPGKEIRVTLFDANHCVGAVMFLIEGDGKAILYTGDVRSEGWWVDALVRHPILIPYTKGRKCLDCIYLDTTFATKEAPNKEFPSKADGIAELLRKVDGSMRDDREVVFYMDAWTFGYEDVWRALAAHLQTKIHLDEYRSRLYRCLGNRAECFTPETAALVGFQLGNHYQKGCLSYEREGCRVHSCERGTRCSVFDDNNVVRITPIITRHQGLEYAELGAGGGQGDLDQVHELELNDIQVVAQLMALCSAKLAGKESLPKLLNLLAKHLQSGGTNIRLDTLSLLEQHGGEGDADGLEDMDKIPLDRFLPVLAKLGVGDGEDMVRSKHSPRTRQITFPYSRHSSYSELRYLVQAFKPKDVYPCTVDERTWNADVSMKSLFGDLCSGESFIHDQFMYNMLNLHRSDADSQVQGEESRRVERTPSPASTPSPERLHANQKRTESASRSASVGRENSVKKRAKLSSPSTLRSTPRSRLEDGLAQRKRAHDAALGAGGSSWYDIQLTSVSGYHDQDPEEEL